MSVLHELVYKAGYCLLGVLAAIMIVGLLTTHNGRSNFMEHPGTMATLAMVFTLFGVHAAVFCERISHRVYFQQQKLLAWLPCYASFQAWLRQSRLCWNYFLAGIACWLFGFVFFVFALTRAIP